MLRYRRHHFMAKGIESKSIADEFLAHSNEEQGHADQLAERIVQLGGEPDFSPQGLAEPQPRRVRGRRDAGRDDQGRPGRRAHRHRQLPRLHPVPRLTRIRRRGACWSPSSRWRSSTPTSSPACCKTCPAGRASARAARPRAAAIRCGRRPPWRWPPAARPAAVPTRPTASRRTAALMNSTAALTRANRLCSQVMNTNPTAPASSSDVPATASAYGSDPDCRKAAAPLPSAMQRRPEIGNEVEHPGGDAPGAGLVQAERQEGRARCRRQAGRSRRAWRAGSAVPARRSPRGWPWRPSCATAKARPAAGACAGSAPRRRAGNRSAAATIGVCAATVASNADCASV